MRIHLLISLLVTHFSSNAKDIRIKIIGLDTSRVLHITPQFNRFGTKWKKKEQSEIAAPREQAKRPKQSAVN